MSAPQSREFAVPTADAMRAWGACLGAACRGGDVIVLTGDLGAGKTTLAQGIARGMGITDAVTSPTFVIARTHPHPAAGPDLVHVDAYRLGGLAEVDDLDLESDLARSVVVVEWGEGLVEGLSDSRLDLVIRRSAIDDDEVRTVEATAHSPRWADALADLAVVPTP